MRTFFTVPPEFDFLAQGEEKCGPSGLYDPGLARLVSLMTTLKAGALFRMPRVTDTLVDCPFRLSAASTGTATPP